MLEDFKNFINKGNFVDIAVAFVIGAAFASVVGAFTSKIVTPLIAMIVNLDNISAMGQFACSDVADADTGAISEVCAGSFGAFLEAILNFIIVGFVMFMVVRSYTKFKERSAEPEPEAEPEADPEDITLLREIRDSLAK